MSTTTAPSGLELTRVYHFSAGHRLKCPDLSPEDNARLYGPCATPHGHNYYLEVTVSGAPDPLTGMLIDVAHLDAIVEGAVLRRVDHETLETVPELRGIITTGEGLARAFWRILARRLGPLGLRQVAVVETAKNRFEYRGEE
jgi:6-pyruvoyltetrahydropterin/6-carboxytetrahydropterin synthase